MIFYDKKQALDACDAEPSLIFELIKGRHFGVVRELIVNNKIDINICDEAFNNVPMCLLKSRQYDLVAICMRKKSFNPNHRNLDGNNIGHLLASDSSVSTLKLVDILSRNKNYLVNNTNNNNETVLDIAINHSYIYTVFKILEDKRFNSIDFLLFRKLYKMYIKNSDYGKYSKLNHLEIIVDSLEEKELLPGMKKLLSQIEDNMEAIKEEIMKNKSHLLENMINSYSVNE